MSKLQQTYKVKAYVNASHAMRWANGVGQKHNHTWELICEIKSLEDKMIVFKDIDTVIKSVTSIISGKYLNDLQEFSEVNPSLENLTEFLFSQLNQELKKIGGQLIRLEVGESPTHSYVISNY